MHAFKDAKDRSWEIIIDPYTIEKVRGRLGTNLYDLGKAIEELFSDPPKFVNALYLLCGDQTEGKVSDRDFCKHLDGDALDRARDAFIEEMVFFCPKAAKETLRKAVELQKSLALKTVAKLSERARQKMAVIDDQFLDNLAEKTALQMEKEALESR